MLIVQGKALVDKKLSEKISSLVLKGANAMGISKAMMEKLMLSKVLLNKKENTIFSTTRYGNVLFSRGSVVPLFIDQILAKKELTVTDPNMTRFLMTLNEAIKLVLFAFNNGKNGDLFIQKCVF